MLNNQNTQESYPPVLKWPQWQWRWGVLLGLVGLVLEVASFFLDLLPPDMMFDVRAKLAVASLSVLIVFPTCEWLVKSGKVLSSRARRYPGLRHRFRLMKKELEDTIISLLSILRPLSSPFEILGARYQNGRVYIALNKMLSPEMSVGDLLILEHSQDGYPLGLFEVIEVRTHDYHAVGRQVDANWKGYVRQQGEMNIGDIVKSCGLTLHWRRTPMGCA